MEKFIPYEKLSKKKRRELDALKRGSWGALNPVTRKTANGKAYDRKKAQSWKKDSDFEPFSYFCGFFGAGDTPEAPLRAFPLAFRGFDAVLPASPPPFRAFPA